MATAVMCDAAKTVGRHEEQLVVPGVGRKRPAMAEHDRLPRAPVLVENPGAILGGDHAHRPSQEYAVDGLYQPRSHRPGPVTGAFRPQQPRHQGRTPWGEAIDHAREATGDEPPGT